ncbi:MAG: hypothetical protein WC277_03930 [Bacilli bacterium]
MSISNLARRVERLEQRKDDGGIRIVYLRDGEEPPVEQPGEHLIVLHVQDMGL